MSIKPIPNTAVATAIRTAFGDTFDAKAGEIKATVTGTGAVRSAVVRIGNDSTSANVTVGTDDKLAAILNGANISLNEWAKLVKKAVAAADKAHDKVVREFTDARKKADKKAEQKRREAEKKAAKKQADKAKKAGKSGKKAAKPTAVPTPAV